MRSFQAPEIIAWLSSDFINGLLKKIEGKTFSDEEKRTLAAKQERLQQEIDSMNQTFKEKINALHVAESKLKERGMVFEESDDKISVLKTSEWNTTYVAMNGSTISSSLRFDGLNGIYRTSQGLVGRLSEVEYSHQGNGFMIKGKWAVQGLEPGYFWFNVSEDSSAFAGEWGYQPDKVEGEWNGVRVLDN